MLNANIIGTSGYRLLTYRKMAGHYESKLFAPRGQEGTRLVRRYRSYREAEKGHQTLARELRDLTYSEARRRVDRWQAQLFLEVGDV